jgi:hypothetical protein
MSNAMKGGRQTSLLIPSISSILVLAIAIIHLTAIATIAAPPLAGYNPAHLPDSPNGLFIDITTFAADSVLPVVSIIDDSWRGNFTPKRHNTADFYWNAVSGVFYDSWRVAAFNRGESFTYSNRDTVEFLYLAKKKRDLMTNRTYTADISTNGFIASGIEVSHGRKLDNLVSGLSVGATIRYLAPRALQYGTMSGNVVPTSPKTYEYNLLLDYAYNHNIIYKRNDEDMEQGGFSDGYGVSADIGFSYHNGKFHAEVLLRDLGGTLFWNSAPYTTAFAVTPVKTTASNGYQEFNPSISGYEGNKPLRQRIPLKTDLSLGYDSDPFSESVTVVLINDQPRTWLEVSYRYSNDLQLSLGYNLDYSSLTYSIATHGLSMGVTLSDFEIHNARALGFQLSYLYSW